MYKLSPSSLGLMKECPRCFWLTQHKVWKRPDSIFPSLPNGMDRILKEHFDNFMKRGKLPPELCNDDCDGMKLFDDVEKLKEWRDNKRGIRFTDNEGNILFGAVDNILVHGKKLIVLDYKTRGYALKEDTHEYYHDQIDIYNFLLVKNGYDAEDYGFLLFYYPDKVLETGEIIFENKLVKLKVNFKNGENIFAKGLKLLNGECPEERCEWCVGVKYG